MKDLIPYIGETKTRRRLDEIFSRQMLGAVLVGSTAGKIIEKSILMLAGTTITQLIYWTIAFIMAVIIFVLWDEVENKVGEKAEEAKEKVEEATEEK